MGNYIGNTIKKSPIPSKDDKTKEKNEMSGLRRRSHSIKAKETTRTDNSEDISERRRLKRYRDRTKQYRQTRYSKITKENFTSE